MNAAALASSDLAGRVEPRAITTANVGPDPSHTDFDLMLRAWNAGTASGRDVALQMADFDRIRAKRANGEPT